MGPVSTAGVVPLNGAVLILNDPVGSQTPAIRNSLKTCQRVAWMGMSEDLCAEIVTTISVAIDTPCNRENMLFSI